MFNKISNYLKDNGPSVATMGSMVCTALAVIFAIKSASKGAEAKENYEREIELLDEKPMADRKPDDRLKLKAYYIFDTVKAYKESIAFGAGSIVLAGAANKLSAKTIAGLSAALALKEDTIKKIYKKANEIYGGDAAPDLKEAVDADVPPFDPDDMHKGKTSKRIEKKEQMERYLDTYSGQTFWEYPSRFESAVQRARDRYDADHGYLNWNKWDSIRGLPDGTVLGIVTNFTKSTPFGVSLRTGERDGIEWNLIIYDHDPETKKDFKILN